MTSYLRVTNATRDTVVAERCRVAESIAQRIFGLHLVPRLEAGDGLLLRGATTIDTTFMSYPIDLVFIDRSGRVTRTVLDLPPWRMVLRTFGGRDCIELPAGAIAESGVQAGDHLTFSPLS
jgi:uncharacterized membrane protein (UPF0127 family)